jgi:hypothetical protein
MVGKVRDDLMDDSFSSIWLELGLPRKKKFLVCQLYREWQYLGQAAQEVYQNSLSDGQSFLINGRGFFTVAKR